MAGKISKGSLILEIIIILAALLLVSVILVPDKIWEEEEQVTKLCRQNINMLFEAERSYYKANGEYTDSLSKLLTFVQTDSGLQQRQAIVSLSRSFVQVINNILHIPSIEQISNISEAAFEITGDLLGNERYFRKHENILATSKEINREMKQFDSSLEFPNFCRTKLFVDSLRNLREKISDYPLQNAILHAINYVDSINTHCASIEKNAATEFWRNENNKISDLINTINKTDIVKVSSVSDRLKRFIDRINSNISAFDKTDQPADKKQMEAERQYMIELHEKFLSPEYFILTKRYGQNALDETDSLLINLGQENFYCPDCNETYLIDSVAGGHLTIECPSLLNEFHKKFLETIEPVRVLPVFDEISQMDTIFSQTKAVLLENKYIIRKNTDVLLSLKEISIEMDAVSNVFFYKYVHEYNDFVKLLEKENKLSVLKTAIEDILNPMDTLATRMETGNISDLEIKLNYYHNKLQKLDSMANALKIPARLKRKYKSSADAFQPVFDILPQIKAGFDPSYVEALRDAEKTLENDLLEALEGKKETNYLIFDKKHINHGYIKDGEMSWEKK